MNLDEIYQAKLNEKRMPVSQGISSFESTSYKNLQDIEVLLFLAVLFLTSADYIFYNF